MRASSHIQLKERKQLTLENFKGVDFSSSPLRVHSNRASNMQNFINEYGVNRKRNGWNELFRIEDETATLNLSMGFSNSSRAIEKICSFTLGRGFIKSRRKR